MNITFKGIVSLPKFASHEKILKSILLIIDDKHPMSLYELLLRLTRLDYKDLPEIEADTLIRHTSSDWGESVSIYRNPKRRTDIADASGSARNPSEQA